VLSLPIPMLLDSLRFCNVNPFSPPKIEGASSPFPKNLSLPFLREWLPAHEERASLHLVGAFDLFFLFGVQAKNAPFLPPKFFPLILIDLFTYPSFCASFFSFEAEAFSPNILWYSLAASNPSAVLSGRQATPSPFLLFSLVFNAPLKQEQFLSPSRRLGHFPLVALCFPPLVRCGFRSSPPPPRARTRFPGKPRFHRLLFSCFPSFPKTIKPILPLISDFSSW